MVYFFCIGAVVFGVLLFKLSEICKQRGWLKYERKDTLDQHYTHTGNDDDENSRTETEQSEGLLAADL